jgi:hypothetical protein
LPSDSYNPLDFRLPYVLTPFHFLCGHLVLPFRVKSDHWLPLLLSRNAPHLLTLAKLAIVYSSVILQHLRYRWLLHRRPVWSVSIVLRRLLQTLDVVADFTTMLH